MDDVLERYRPRLFGIAYRMLGSVADAEDVLQTAFLRWHQAGSEVARNPEAWLVAVTTRLSIDRLRRAEGERERYPGDWLPEPLVTSAPPSTDAPAERASDLSVAFLVLLERLSPDERAAFLLREVFGADYGEIGRVLDRSEVACRQIVHRARARVREGRARFPVPAEAKERLVRQFLAHLQAGNEDALLAMVAHDAEWRSDGGGRVPVARNLRSARRIVGFLVRLGRNRRFPGWRQLVWVNGEPAIASYAGDRLISVLSLETDGEQVIAFYSVLNPDKLGHVARAQ